jgi:hypothetical protein
VDGDEARLRVSDADRDHAAGELSEHFQAGRLTQDEFDERVGKAISARTRGDLAELLADLPATRPADGLPAARSGPPVRSGLSWTGPLIAMVAVIAALTAVSAAAAGHGYWGPPWPLFLIAFFVLRGRARGWHGGSR